MAHRRGGAGGSRGTGRFHSSPPGEPLEGQDPWRAACFSVPARRRRMETSSPGGVFGNATRALVVRPACSRCQQRLVGRRLFSPICEEIQALGGSRPLRRRRAGPKTDPPAGSPEPTSRAPGAAHAPASGPLARGPGERLFEAIVAPEHFTVFREVGGSAEDAAG